jgi:hypothetical protein
MAIINIHTLIDVLGGLGVTDAKIVATASSGGKAATRNVNADVVFPKRIELAIVDGDPVDDFELIQLPVGMYWSVGVYVNGLTNFKRTVRLPDGAGPFDFDQLVDVDPTTALADPNTEAAAVYLAEVQDAADRAEAATYGMAQVSTAVNYTLVLGDAGKHIYVTATGRTITVPANSSVAFAIGTVVTVVNPASVSTSIAITTDTMYLAATGTTGTRTLAAYGIATLLKLTSTTWIISGYGLT